MSTWTLGPIVAEVVTSLMYRPLAEAGLRPVESPR